jgi:hypothetical protein
VHGGIIHVNQQDRSGGGEIWSCDDFRGGWKWYAEEGLPGE